MDWSNDSTQINLKYFPNSIVRIGLLTVESLLPSNSNAANRQALFLANASSIHHRNDIKNVPCNL